MPMISMRCASERPRRSRLPHDENITFLQPRESIGQTGPRHLAAGDALIFNDHLAPCRLQRLLLQREVLFFGRDAGITDLHASSTSFPRSTSRVALTFAFSAGRSCSTIRAPYQRCRIHGEAGFQDRECSANRSPDKVPGRDHRALPPPSLMMSSACFDGYNVSSFSRKACKSRSAVNRSMRTMLSRMCSCNGPLEGTNDLGLHTFLHSRLQCSFLDQVHWRSE
jgi:hypothetical protein